MKEINIEENLISKLKDLKYTFREDITNRDTLEKNFRQKFEELNRVHLTDSEYNRFKDEVINQDVFASAKLLRARNTFEREDGTPLHYTLVNLKDWCKNSFEVVHQLRINTRNSHHRYDVILLLNGIPVVQIELKGLTINPRKAMQQIVDYKNDSGNGYTNSLLCFVQLFIVSNRSDTWYFANNNQRHFSFDADERFLPLYQFADESNKKITHLDDFADKFLKKCVLGEMLSHYMILVTSEQKLMMMRPYQIYAVKAIEDCIHENRGNGYIWHTTGSGKTLTSFKASTLLKDNPEIEKCLFVVDRKDLDRQTRQEFNKFQEGCVEENTNTGTLVRRIISEDYADKVIVTTIQKLGLALDEKNKQNYKEQLKHLSDKRLVFIFDECHRSQFGENHKAIKDFFPNSQLFGFTGTPIFEKNSTYRKIDGQEASYQTTDDIFQKMLHSYTITNAIEDRNVLRFHIDYYKPEGENKDQAGESLNREAIVKAILDKHEASTANRKFNALLATSSINNAIDYYQLFKKVQAEKISLDNKYNALNVVSVFSPPAEGNKDIQQLQEDLEQEKIDNQETPDEKKEALKTIIADFNLQFGTNHTIARFDSYYQDVQSRIKDQKYSNQDYPHSNKIDITIVVDMLLTGFDSKYLNSLYVDKNLKYHGLIQAFSRTNRVLNDSKPNGNIIDFREQQNEVDLAITLFSGERTDRPKEIWLVDPAPVIVEKLENAVSELDNFMNSQGLTCLPEEVANLKGDEARGQFINLFKEIQRCKTQLDQYTDLSVENSETIEKLIPQEQLQAFRGVYLETARRLKEVQKNPKNVSPEIEQLDFEFVLFASSLIDYDYIMNLISKYTQATPSKQKMSRKELIGLIMADAKFVNEREDITEYIYSLKEGEALSEQEIKKGYENFKAEKNKKQIKEIGKKHKIEYQSLQTFINNIIKRMIFDGEVLSDLLSPLDLGWKARMQKELELMDDLIPILHKLAQGKEISGLTAYEK